MIVIMLSMSVVSVLILLFDIVLRLILCCNFGYMLRWQLYPCITCKTFIKKNKPTNKQKNYLTPNCPCHGLSDPSLSLTSRTVTFISKRENEAKLISAVQPYPLTCSRVRRARRERLARETALNPSLGTRPEPKPHFIRQNIIGLNSDVPTPSFLY